MRGASEYHGADGPLWASDIGATHPLVEAIIAGAGELGIPRNDDFNGATQEGAGYYQLTTRTRPALLDGRRLPAAGAQRAEPARRDRRARDARAVRRHARATGVAYRQARRRRSRPRAARSAPCRRRAAVAAAAATVGRRPARAAAAARHSPSSTRCAGVGENLQDHLQARVIFRCTQADHDQRRRCDSLDGKLRMGCDYALRRTRPDGGRHQPGRHVCARAIAGSDAARTCSSTSPRCRPTWRARPVHHVLRLHDVGVPAAPDIARPRAHQLAPIRSRRRRCSRTTCRRREDRATLVAGMRLARRLAATVRCRRYVAGEYRPGPRRSHGRRRCSNSRTTPAARSFIRAARRRWDRPPMRAPSSIPTARARPRRPARRRLRHHADAGFGQHQRARRDDRREGGRP